VHASENLAVVLVVSCHFPKSITMTYWQQVGNFPVYGEVTGKHVYFGHYNKNYDGCTDA